MSESFDTLWFGDCSNTYHEEQKQLAYAGRMGLLASWHGAHPPTFDLMGRSVIDIGGGPASLLLKCVNLGPLSTVLDPGAFPAWVGARYATHGVKLVAAIGESELAMGDFDEAWIYNVLQHARDPEKVIANARRWARTIRIFEWIEMDPYPGHPHMLTATGLDEWLGAPGFVANVNESGAVGRAYYGVFGLPGI